MKVGIDSRLRLLLALVALAIGAAILAPAIPQDLAYHQFADRRAHLGVPNFWNVMTNLPFLCVGLAGIGTLYRGTPAIVPELRAGYLTFFIGIALIGPGSAYYHAAPGNATLVWDRLPMTLAFMALLSIIVAEYISVSAGRNLLWPMVLAGIASVVYWQVTEARGQGDLRPYGLVQFLPMGLIPLILLMFRSSFSGVGYFWAMLAAYAAAKLAELLDEPVFRALHLLSGHALKHLLAAFGAYCFLLAIRRRHILKAER